MVKSKKKAYRKIDTSEVEEWLRLKDLKDKIEKVPANLLYAVDELPKRNIVSLKPSIVKIRDKQQKPQLSTSSKKSAEPKIKSIKNAIKTKKSEYKADLIDLWPLDESKEAVGSIASNIASTTASKRLLPASLGAPTAIPLMKIATSGQSYNPDADSYQMVMQEVMNEEYRFAREEKSHQQRVKPLTTELLNYYSKDYVAKMDFMLKQKALQNLASGKLLEELQSRDTESKTRMLANDEDEDESSTVDISKPKITKKNKTQRNKEIRLRKEQKQVTALQRLKRFNKSFGRIGEYLKQIKLKEAELQKRKELKLKRHMKAIEEAQRGKGKTIRLGKNKFNEDPTEISLPHELSGSLRTLKVKGSAARDCIQSIYRRGLLDAPPLLTSAYMHKIKTISKAKRLSKRFKSSFLQEQLKC